MKPFTFFLANRMARQDTTSPATKTYCVWADYSTRCYQEIGAESPRAAHAIAAGQPDCWRNCYEHEDRDAYRLSDDVQDVETGEYFTVGERTACKTCGSEIVATVTDGHFRGGECGPCEYERYTAQADLLASAASARAAFEERISSPTEERGSVLRGGGSEEDCRDLDDRIVRHRHLIETADAAVTGPGGTRAPYPLSPRQDDDQ